MMPYRTRAFVIPRVSRTQFNCSSEGATFSLASSQAGLARKETATVLARLHKDLPDRELETGHYVSAIQNVGFGEDGDVAR
jgi:hypothetical protein